MTADRQGRNFESGPARRERSPISIGIVGPSGSGKTLSAILVCEGMSRVTPGDTWLIDTNNRRSLHHADDHKFSVVHMPPPYSPLDWRAACQHAIDKGARRIIPDSISDLHEGEGGILDMHEQYIDERTNGAEDPKVRDRWNMAAWKFVKREQLKLKLWMIQQPVDWIFTFRAKEKIRIEGGGKPVDMGWQPLGPEELIYELLFKCLLRPQADGRPTWTSNIIHEQALMKLPGFFRDLFRDNPPLSADIGEKLARWQAGADIAAPVSSSTAMSSRPASGGFVGLAERIDAASAAELPALEADARASWKRLNAEQRDKVSAAVARAKVRHAAPSAPPPGEPTEEEMRAHAAQEDAEAARR
jgi:hypothetical protein